MIRKSMNKKKITLLFLLILTGMVSNGQEMDYERNLEIVRADYGTCYTIGNYMLCPEQKLIRVGRMFGTVIGSSFGYFPDSTLKYDGVTMIIFGGFVFFDKSDFNIDWNTVELRLYRNNYFEFTDGEILYFSRQGNNISIKDKTYDKNKHKLDIEKRLKHRNDNELTEGFSVKGNSFYFKNIPILEPFDVSNLRTIASKGGFETNYITDGKQVVFGGGKGGYSSTKKDGKDYVLAKRWIIEGVDLPSLRILGRDLLADKNALYYRENVIPFAELKGFKFIIREMT